MKKLTYLLLAFSLIFIFTACGQGNNDDTGQTTPVKDRGTNQSLNDENAENNSNEAKSGNDHEDDYAEDNGNDANNIEENNGIENTINDVDEVGTIDDVSLFFSDDQLMEIYRVNTGVTVTADEAGAMEAYRMWLSGPEAANLTGLLPDTTAVQSVEFKDDVAYVSFNSDILNANVGSTGEGMIVDQITAIASQFGYDKTQILIEGEIAEEFLGHMTVDEPMQAPDVSQYKVAE